MKRGAIRLRAAREEDLPRLRALWRESFGNEPLFARLTETCFVPGQVQSSLVLLEDDRNFIPPYVLFAMVNDEALARHPELLEACMELDHAVTDAEMPPAGIKSSVSLIETRSSGIFSMMGSIWKVTSSGLGVASEKT